MESGLMDLTFPWSFSTHPEQVFKIVNLIVMPCLKVYQDLLFRSKRKRRSKISSIRERRKKGKTALTSLCHRISWPLTVPGDAKQFAMHIHTTRCAVVVCSHALLPLVVCSYTLVPPLSEIVFLCCALALSKEAFKTLLMHSPAPCLFQLCIFNFLAQIKSY